MNSINDMKVNPDYISELQNGFNNYCFKRIEKINGVYVTNEINRNVAEDFNIFKETLVKRALRGYSAPFVPKAIKNKLSYFSLKENEKPESIYQYDRVQNVDSKLEEYAIQNLGHATVLIQIPGLNILTDPILVDLNKLLYPAQTESWPNIDKLPVIDFIIISHNHRDHVDKCSLQKILQKHKKNSWLQPQIFVPKGDKTLFQDFGFKDVQEIEWYTKISINKNINGILKTVHFISIPADHRSGRYLSDHHQSLVTGWVVNSEQENVIFKFSGDTRGLSNEWQKAVDAVIWYEIKNKTCNKNKSNDDVTIPDIICLEPSGPNYTRYYMDNTHQSTSYSALLKFVEAENLAVLSRQSSQKFLEKIKTYMMHHRKFELGVDRFNEGFFVFKKLLQYLDLDKNELLAELKKQKEKMAQKFDKEKLQKNLLFTSRPSLFTLPEYSSILVHAKDFIIEEIIQMTNNGMSKNMIKEYLLKTTVFAKIGERLNDKQITNSKLDVQSIQKYSKTVRDDKSHINQIKK